MTNLTLYELYHLKSQNFKKISTFNGLPCLTETASIQLTDLFLTK